MSEKKNVLVQEKVRGLGQMNIGGKDRPFQVNGIRQTHKFCEEMGNLEIDEYLPQLMKMHNGKIGDGFKITNHIILIAFIYSCLFAGAKRERVPVDFDYETVVRWYEEADEKEGVELLKPLHMWVELMNEATAKLPAEEEKKA